MSDEHTALIRGLVVAALSFAVSWTWAMPAEAEQVMGIGCRIDVETNGGAVRLEAMARSRSNVSGHYRFDVRKNGEAGSSQNIQSGDFSLEADRETILSTTVVGASAADHYQARLVLNSNSGSVSCISP
jgi:curli production assembly/transport CsgH protein